MFTRLLKNSGGRVDVYRNIIWLSYELLNDVDCLLRVFAHEYAHLHDKEAGLFPNWYNLEGDFSKARFRRAMQEHFKMERSADEKAGNWLRQHFPRLEYNSFYCSSEAVLENNYFLEKLQNKEFEDYCFSDWKTYQQNLKKSKNNFWK